MRQLDYERVDFNEWRHYDDRASDDRSVGPERSLGDLRLIVHKLTMRGVRIEFVKEYLTFTGEDSPLANLIRRKLPCSYCSTQMSGFPKWDSGQGTVQQSDITHADMVLLSRYQK